MPLASRPIKFRSGLCARRGVRLPGYRELRKKYDVLDARADAGTRGASFARADRAARRRCRDSFCRHHALAARDGRRFENRRFGRAGDRESDRECERCRSTRRD